MNKDISFNYTIQTLPKKTFEVSTTMFHASLLLLLLNLFLFFPSLQHSIQTFTLSEESIFTLLAMIGISILLFSIHTNKPKLVEISHFIFGFLVVTASIFSRSKHILNVVMITIIAVIMLRHYYNDCPLALLEEEKKEYIPNVWQWMSKYMNWSFLFPIFLFLAAYRYWNLSIASISTENKNAYQHSISINDNKINLPTFEYNTTTSNTAFTESELIEE